MDARQFSATAAVLVAAAVGVVAPPAQAHAPTAAAACSGAAGVTVIVDYNEIGGPARAGCDPDGAGRSASQVFPDAGFPLEYHPRQPGYVCKITGLPDDRPCLENDSFWSLWWSDGRSGEWRFANQGVGGLSVRDGGYLAFSWHEGGGRAQPPDFAPTAHQDPGGPSDRPSDRPSDGADDSSDDGADGGGISSAPSSSAASPSASLTAADPTSAGPSGSGAGMRPGEPDGTSTDAATTATSSGVPGAAEITAGPPPGDLAGDTSDPGGGALATWVGLGLAALVLGAAGLVAVLRRRTG